ncbi:hypothetical protein Q7P37_010322 [Cladosporium fusiforme]
MPNQSDTDVQLSDRASTEQPPDTNCGIQSPTQPSWELTILKQPIPNIVLGSEVSIHIQTRSIVTRSFDIEDINLIMVPNLVELRVDDQNRPSEPQLLDGSKKIDSVSLEKKEEKGWARIEGGTTLYLLIRKAGRYRITIVLMRVSRSGAECLSAVESDQIEVRSSSVDKVNFCCAMRHETDLSRGADTPFGLNTSPCEWLSLNSCRLLRANHIQCAGDFWYDRSSILNLSVLGAMLSSASNSHPLTVAITGYLDLIANSDTQSTYSTVIHLRIDPFQIRTVPVQRFAGFSVTLETAKPQNSECTHASPQFALCKEIQVTSGPDDDEPAHLETQHIHLPTMAASTPLYLPVGQPTVDCPDEAILDLPQLQAERASSRKHACEAETEVRGTLEPTDQAQPGLRTLEVPNSAEIMPNSPQHEGSKSRKQRRQTVNVNSSLLDEQPCRKRKRDRQRAKSSHQQCMESIAETCCRAIIDGGKAFMSDNRLRENWRGDLNALKPDSRTLTLDMFVERQRNHATGLQRESLLAELVHGWALRCKQGLRKTMPPRSRPKQSPSENKSELRGRRRATLAIYVHNSAAREERIGVHAYLMTAAIAASSGIASEFPSTHKLEGHSDQDLKEIADMTALLLCEDLDRNSDQTSDQQWIDIPKTYAVDPAREMITKDFSHENARCALELEIAPLEQLVPLSFATLDEHGDKAGKMPIEIESTQVESRAMDILDGGQSRRGSPFEQTMEDANSPDPTSSPRISGFALHTREQTLVDSPTFSSFENFVNEEMFGLNFSHSPDTQEL